MAMELAQVEVLRSHNRGMMSALDKARKGNALDVMSLVVHRIKGRDVAKAVLSWQSNRATCLAEQAVEAAELMRLHVERGAIESEMRRLDLVAHAGCVKSRTKQITVFKLRRLVAKMRGDAGLGAMVQWRENCFQHIDTRVTAASHICHVMLLWQGKSQELALRLELWRYKARFESGINSQVFVRNHTVATWAEWLYAWRGDVLVHAMLQWKTTVDESRILGLEDKLGQARHEAEVLLTREILSNIGSELEAVPVMETFEEWRLIFEAQKNAELQRGLLLSKAEWSWAVSHFKRERARRFVKPSLLVNVPAFLEDATFAWSYLY